MNKRQRKKAGSVHCMFHDGPTVYERGLPFAALHCAAYGLDLETAAIYLKEEMVVDSMPEELKAVARAMMEGEK